MQSDHEDLIQNYKAELEARDSCLKSIYALRQLAKAVASGDRDDMNEALRQSRIVLNDIDHSTR